MYLNFAFKLFVELFHFIQMDRSITSLPLSSESIDLLQKAGFVSVESLFNLRPTELSREVGCSHEEAVSILKSIQPTDKQITIANIPNAKVLIDSSFTWFIFLRYMS